jgi:hypothetical protein
MARRERARVMAGIIVDDKCKKCKELGRREGAESRCERGVRRRGGRLTRDFKGLGRDGCHGLFHCVPDLALPRGVLNEQ